MPFELAFLFAGIAVVIVFVVSHFVAKEIDEQKNKSGFYVERTKTIMPDRMNDYERYLQLIRTLIIDETTAELYQDFIKRSQKYMGIRINWSMMKQSEKLQEDSYRTSVHNGVIDAFHILLRYLKKQNPGQQERLEDIENKLENRKDLGDFACYCCLVIAMEER